MANAAIVYGNKTDDGVITGGSWLPTQGLGNLTNSRQSQVARSIDLQLSSTQVVQTWTKQQKIRAMGIVNHNFSENAQVRITTYDFNGVLLYDSGFYNVWPEVFAYGDLEWEDDNWWSLQYDNAEKQGVRWLVAKFFDTVQLCYSIKIEINDTSNTDGFVQFARLMFGDYWTPVVNMNVGATIAWNPNTKSQTSLSGSKSYSRKTGFRSVNFALNNMSQKEAMSKAYEIMRTMGIDGECIFAWDTNVDEQFIRRTFYASMSELSPIAVPNYDRQTTVFNFEERL